jgi:prepilin-type processing-associated H-X9-DG protein
MPIQFTCPHCGQTTNVADQYAGQSGPCAHCGKTIMIPSPQFGSPFDAGSPPPRRGLSTGWIVFIVLASVGAVMLVCGGIMAALLLPAVQAAREAARRIACSNNMKQIGLAIYNYAQANKCYPPAYVADKNGKPLYSWRVLILPYMECDYQYRQFHLDESWDSPHNMSLASQMPRCFCCPSAFAAGSGSVTCYAMIVGPHAFGNGAKPRRPAEIKDAQSNTIMMVEAVGEKIPWTAPIDVDAADVVSIQTADVNNPLPIKGISSCHSRGANVLMGDGSVQFLSSTIDKKALKAMTTIDGGEKENFPNSGLLKEDED